MAVEDAVDNLVHKFDSIGLQDQVETSGKTTQSRIKPTKEPKTDKKPPRTSTTTTTTTAEPLIVRRSRRGERAISSHPLVGQYRVELTSSERRWCGKFALGISTEAQLGVRLTAEEFDEVFSGDEARAFNGRNGWANGDNFYDEQLDFVLRLWGLGRGLGRLQLGVVRDFEGAYVNSCVPAGIPWGVDDGDDENGVRDVKREECRTVWVHNDNAMLLGRPCNHFSGVVVLQKGA